MRITVPLSVALSKAFSQSQKKNLLPLSNLASAFTSVIQEANLTTVTPADAQDFQKEMEDLYPSGWLTSSPVNYNQTRFM